MPRVRYPTSPYMRDNNYDRYNSLLDTLASQRDKEYEDPTEQQKYDAESDKLFDEIVRGIVGGVGSNDPANVNRAMSMADTQPMQSEFADLGYKRKRGKGEQEGSFAMAEYPQLHYAIWAAKAGLDPSGAMPGMFSGIFPGSPEDQAMQEKRRQWGVKQESMLKPGGFWNWM